MSAEPEQIGESDVREDVTAAFEALESAPTPEPAGAPAPAAEAAPEPQVAPEPAKADKPAQEAPGKPEAVKPKPTPKPAAKPESAAVKPEPQPEQPATTIKTEKAPQSWTPAAREKWATLPGEVRAEVTKRERETARVLQETADARKGWETFRTIVAPFEGMMRAEGVEPTVAVKNLVETAAALRTAPAQHKEAIVGTIIRSYGIDPAGVARYLQSLPAHPAAPQPQAVDPNAMVSQVRQQVLREMEERQRATERATIENQIAEFQGGAEFFDDVAPMMPGIIAARRAAGLPVSLEAVYNQACQSHPEVSAVLKQREAAQQANAQRASTQAARNAATSIKGGPAVAAPKPPSPPTDDIRSTIEWVLSQQA